MIIINIIITIILLSVLSSAVQRLFGTKICQLLLFTLLPPPSSPSV